MNAMPCSHATCNAAGGRKATASCHDEDILAATNLGQELVVESSSPGKSRLII